MTVQAILHHVAQANIEDSQQYSSTKTPIGKGSQATPRVVCMHAAAVKPDQRHMTRCAAAEGRLLAECEETGLGYRWEGAALGTLQDYQPKNGHRCAQSTRLCRERARPEAKSFEIGLTLAGRAL